MDFLTVGRASNLEKRELSLAKEQGTIAGARDFRSVGRTSSSRGWLNSYVDALGAPTT